MSGIRRFIRKSKALSKPKKTVTKVTFQDCLLGVGVTLSFLGVVVAPRSYYYHREGRPEGIREGPLGTFHVEAVEAGMAYYRDRAILYGVCAVIGLLLSGLSLAIKHDARSKKST